MKIKNNETQSERSLPPEIPTIAPLTVPASERPLTRQELELLLATYLERIVLERRRDSDFQNGSKRGETPSQSRFDLVTTTSITFPNDSSD